MRRYKFSVLDNLKLKSYAKINLYLHVLNKRDDGFHNISSLLSRIDLYDSITFEKSEIFEVEYSGPEGNKVSNDNITQLITYLKNEKIIDELNYRIKINKNIPIGAGLGGGSSNVASIIKVLVENKIINEGVDVINIAKLMGSDIEFFLYDKAAIIEGKGSIARLFEIQEPIIILLVNPGVNLSTKKVFETNNLFSANFRAEETLNNNLNKLFKITHNDLEDAAIKLCPDIGKIKDEISKQKGLIASRMTGSGSSYFAIFEDRNATLLAEQQIKNYNSNWWTSIVTTI